MASLRGVFLVLGVSLLAFAGCGSDGSGIDVDAAADGRNDGAGGDGSADQAPEKPPVVGTPVPGGGTGGGALEGVLGVYVLDERDDKPVAGAFVQVGETAATRLTATTDEKGYAGFAHASLTAPVTVTAGKAGLRTETLVGLGVKSVTLTLVPTKGGVDAGKLRGTVDFSTLPDPPVDSHRLAYADYQRDHRLNHPRNAVPQGAGGLIPDNVYAPTVPLVAKTEFALNAPAGALDVYALVVRADTNGSPLDPNQWTLTLTDIGILDGLMLGKGEEKTSIVIPVVAPLSETLTVTLPALPAGFTQDTAFALIDRGPGRLLPVATPDGDVSGGIPMPALAGPFAGTSAWVIARADEYAMEPLPFATAMTVVRGVKDFSKPATPPAYMPTPSAITYAAGAITYAPAAGASLHNFLFSSAAAGEVWNVTVLDALAKTAKVPEVPAGAGLETIPTGAISISATAVAIPAFDAKSASYRELTKTTTALSSRRVAASN